MKNNFIILIFVAISLGCGKKSGNDYKSQTTYFPDRNTTYLPKCLLTELSTNFNFDISMEGHPDFYIDYDSCIIKIKILDKNSNAQIGYISTITKYSFNTVYQDCINTRSYSTGLYIKKEIINGNYGGLIVADFNSDSREDLAVVKDSDIEGKVLYNYYVQDINKKFVLDSFLTNTMVYFPVEVDKNERSLTTRVYSGVCYLDERKFSYDLSTNRWTKIHQKLIDICK